MEERKKRKKKIIGGTLAFLISLTVIIIFLYRDEIKQAYINWQAEKVGWNTEEELGEIKIPVNTETIEDDKEEYVTDSLGIKYIKTKFFNKEYEVLLPKDWEIIANQNRIQVMHPNYKNTYAQIEISITPLGEFDEETSLLRLRNESFDLFATSFRYNGYSDEYEVFLYEVSNNHVEKNGFLYQPFKLKMNSIKKSDSKYEPYIANYYTFLGKEGYQITVCGPKNQEIAIEEISRMVVESFKASKQTINIEEYQLSKLNTNVILKGDNKAKYEFVVNKEWECLYNSYNIHKKYPYMIYKLTDDISSPEYGMFLTAQIVPKSDLKIESYNKYLTQAYAMGPYNNIRDFIGIMNRTDSETSLKIYSEETYYKGDYYGKIYEYVKFFVASKENPYYNAVQVGNYPIYNYIYIFNISDKFDMLINITHNEQTNSQIAYKYLMDFVSKVSF